MASLWKRSASPYWVCCYTAPDGTQLKRSTKERDRRKALAVCVEIERASHLARQGQLTEVQARKIIGDIYQRSTEETLPFTDTATFLREWADSKATTRAGGTALRYKRTIEDFLVLLDKKAKQPLSAVVPRDISGLRDKQIREGKSATTANMVVKTLRIPFNLARRHGIILNNPAEAVDLLTSISATRTTFSRPQIRSMLALADEEWTGMILFGACHGLRIGDASRLSWENIDAERQTLRLIAEKTKRGNKGRVEEYPLHGDVQTYLGKLKVNDNPKARLFPALSTRSVSGDRGLSLTFRRLMAKAGVHADEETGEKAKGKGRRFFSLGFHSLRHTAISEQANRGISKEVRMKLSGHKSDVHEHYTHHELAVLRKEIEKVPSFYD